MASEGRPSFQVNVGSSISAITVSADGRRVAVVGRTLFKIARIKRTRALGLHFADWIDGRRPHTAAGGLAQNALASVGSVGSGRSASERGGGGGGGRAAGSGHDRANSAPPAKLALAEVSSNDAAYNPSLAHRDLIATAATSKAVNIWTDSHGVPRIIASLGHARTPSRVAWHPSSPTMVLVASPERSVRYWDTRTGSLAASFRAGAGSRDLAFAPSAVSPHRFAVALESGVLQLWDVRNTAQPELRLVAHPNGAIRTVSWCHAPDEHGRYLLASGGSRGRIKVWDVESALRNAARASSAALLQHHRRANAMAAPPSGAALGLGPAAPPLGATTTMLGRDGGASSSAPLSGALSESDSDVSSSASTSATAAAQIRLGRELRRTPPRGARAHGSAVAAAKPVHLINAPASVTTLRWRPPLATVGAAASASGAASPPIALASAAATASGAAVRIWDVAQVSVL